MRPLLVLGVVALAVTACRDPAPVSADAALELGSERLDFGPVPRGLRTELPLSIRNTSRVQFTVTLSAEDAITFDAPHLEIDSGETIEVPVRFTSTRLGPHEGSVLLRVEGTERQLPWTAQVVPPPQCPTPRPCHGNALDEANNCIELAERDGTPCAVTPETCGGDEGLCADGICVPLRLGCDDGDACTRDRCIAGSGCVNEDISGSCDVGTHPCRVAICDPRFGCGHVAVDDGVPCGPADCVTAHLCRGGSCVAEPVADGAQCGASSPCQAPGVCVAGTCSQPQAQPLALKWEVPLDPERQRATTVALDRGGNAYWLEQDPTSLFLRSVNADGEPRFEVNVGEHGESAWTLMIRGEPPDETVLLADRRAPRVEIRSSTTGALAYAVDLREVLAPRAQPTRQTPPPQQLRMDTETVARQATIWLVTTFSSEVVGSTHATEQRGAAITALDATTGEVRRTVTAPELHGAPIVDEEANLYVSATNGQGVYWLESYAPDVVERYRLSLPYAPVGATSVFHDRLYYRDWVFRTNGSLLRTSTLSTPLNGSALTRVLGTRSSLYLLTYAPGGTITLHRGRPATGDVFWSQPLPEFVSSGLQRLFVTDEDGALLPTARVEDGTLAYRLRGYDRFGQTWSCPWSTDEVLLLGDEVLLSAAPTSLRAWTLPGITAEWDGWSNAWGDPSLSHAAGW